MRVEEGGFSQGGEGRVWESGWGRGTVLPAGVGEGWEGAWEGWAGLGGEKKAVTRICGNSTSSGSWAGRGGRGRHGRRGGREGPRCLQVPVGGGCTVRLGGVGGEGRTIGVGRAKGGAGGARRGPVDGAGGREGRGQAGRCGEMGGGGRCRERAGGVRQGKGWRGVGGRGLMRGVRGRGRAGTGGDMMHGCAHEAVWGLPWPGCLVGRGVWLSAHKGTGMRTRTWWGWGWTWPEEERNRAAGARSVKHDDTGTAVPVRALGVG